MALLASRVKRGLAASDYRACLRIRPELAPTVYACTSPRLL